MKTKDFIKMLQEADPEGEGYIRMDGGFPRFAIAKEGYWDGSYAYLDNDNNYVTSTNGYKVDIYSMNISDFVEDLYRHNETKWEDVEKRFKFELYGYAESQMREREQRVLDQAREAFDMMVDIYTRMDEKKKNKNK